jgi:hypothetical protein
MKLLPAAALVAVLSVFASPAFAGCEEEIDALSKAISGPVTMASGHRAAMMRMALHGYDQCMAGDPKSFDSIRDQVMAAIKASLGGHE